MSPYRIRLIRAGRYYLDNDVPEDLLVGGRIVLDLINDLVLSLLVELLYQLVNCLHLLNSSSVLLCRFLDSESDFVLL